MEVFPTLLAIVVLRAHLLVHDAYTATVLPDFALIALNEHIARRVSERVVGSRSARSRVRVSELWRARVLLLSTDATSDFSVLSCIIYQAFFIFDVIVVFGIVPALAASSLGRVGPKRRADHVL